MQSIEHKINFKYCFTNSHFNNMNLIAKSNSNNGNTIAYTAACIGEGRNKLSHIEPPSAISNNKDSKNWKKLLQNAREQNEKLMPSAQNSMQSFKSYIMIVFGAKKLLFT